MIDTWCTYWGCEQAVTLNGSLVELRDMKMTSGSLISICNAIQPIRRLQPRLYILPE